MHGQSNTVQAGDKQKITSTEAMMLADMSRLGYSPLTQKVYGQVVRRMAEHFSNRTLEQITLDEARGYLRQLKQRGIKQTTWGNQQAAIRFLFEVTFKKTWNVISPLRQRMLEDMDLHGFSPKTQTSYVRSVIHLNRYFNKRPERLTDQELRQ